MQIFRRNSVQFYIPHIFLSHVASFIRSGLVGRVVGSSIIFFTLSMGSLSFAQSASEETGSENLADSAKNTGKTTDVTTKLEDMVVVATKSESRLADIPYTAYQITPEEMKLRLQPQIYPETFERIPGMMLQKTGRGMTSPFMRGFTSQRVVLLTDGIRFNNPIFREGPNQFWSLVDTFFFDNTEVLMGPASVLYGSDAIGGVVNAKSSPLPRGKDAAGLQWFGGEGIFRYSSAERSFSEHINSAFGYDDEWSMRLGLTRQDFGELRTGDSQDNPETNYEQWGANIRFRYWLDEDNTIYAGFDQFDQDDVNRTHRTDEHVDFRGTYNKNGTEPKDDSRTFDHDRRQFFVRYEKRNGSGWLEEMDIAAYWQYLEVNLDRIRRNRPSEPDASDRSNFREISKSKIDSFGTNLRLQTPSNFGTWTYGIDYRHDISDTRQDDVAGPTHSNPGQVTPQIQGKVADDATYDLLGLYLQNEKDITERFGTIAGIRYTYAALDADSVNFSGTERGLDGNWDGFTGNLRLNYRALQGNRLNFFTGVSQGFRAPNFSDATRDGEFGGGTEVPTAGLDAERFTTLELGAKSNSKMGRLLASYFYTHFEDRIGRFNKNGTPTKRNIDNGYVHGFETKAEIFINEEWTLFGGMSWQEGREQSFVNLNTTRKEIDSPVSRLLPLNGHVGVRWEPEPYPVWLELNVQMADDQDKYTQREENDNRFPTGGTPGYTVYNIRGGWQVTKNLDLVLAVENLTDKKYRIHGSGVNEPGINVITTACLTF
mgnify:CR=1 FL=1